MAISTATHDLFRDGCRGNFDELAVVGVPMPASARIEVSGQIDIATAPAVAAACRRAIADDRAQRLDVDLSGVEFCDASGLAVFVIEAQRLRARGGRLRLVAVPEPIAKVIRLVRLDHLLG